MASHDDTLNLDYDERGDVLYASLGPPQASLSYEITKDIWLDYVPPNRTVVGITVIGFLAHYPVEDRTQLLTVARAAVQDLLRTYPRIPPDERSEENAIFGESPSANEPTIRIAPVPWLHLQNYSTAAVGTYAMPLTRFIGVVSLFETPRLQEGGYAMARNDAA
jgi:uncharacterized protein YuzE